jgi:hypothetical protein
LTRPLGGCKVLLVGGTAPEKERENMRTDTTGHPTCDWYPACDLPAVYVVAHPVLGGVNVCDRCHDRHDLGDRVTARWVTPDLIG